MMPLDARQQCSRKESHVSVDVSLVRDLELMGPVENELSLTARSH